MYHTKENVIKLLKSPSCKVCTFWDPQAYTNFDQKLGWCDYYNTQPSNKFNSDGTCKGFWVRSNQLDDRRTAIDRY